MHTRLCFVWCLGFALVTACGDSDGGPSPVDASEPCATDEDCNDGTFCNGVERCELVGGSRACVVTRPCLDGQRCDEERSRCVTECGVTMDADGDGSVAGECGGDDCDDSDARRFPGNTEVCDADDVDEDCDPRTFGSRDADMDDFVDDQCCNKQPDGSLSCGDDCNDADPTTNPNALEVCDRRDNDCDGEIDEGASDTTFYADADGDGFGDPASVEMACTRPEAHVDRAGDCDDADPSVHPDADEICDGLDQDCSADGAAEPLEDADGDGHGAADAPCEGGSLPLDDCDDEEPTVHPGADEVCDGIDNDCDPETPLDEGCAARILVRTGSSLILRGGNTGGDNYFCEDPGFDSCGPGCPTGMGLVGLVVDHDSSRVHRVAGLCRELELVRTEVDTYQVSWGADGNVTARGSGGSSTATSECPPDEWVIGFHGRADDSNVGRLGVTCGTVSMTGSREDGYGTSTTFTTKISSRGGSVGSEFDDRCTADELIGGYEGFVHSADGSLAGVSPFCGSSFVDTR